MTPKELNERLIPSIEAICQQLLPQGKRLGGNWNVDSIGGAEGNSCRIQLTGHKAGIWADFAGNDKGDILMLYQKVKGATFKQALQWAKEYLGIKDCDRDFTVKPSKPLHKLLPIAPTSAVVDWFAARGISADILNKYRVSSKGTVINFPYYKDGKLMFVKYRDIAKSKEDSMFVEAGGTQILFGWQAIPEDARSIVITEGEPDTLAYAMCGIPAVSVPVGGGTGNKQDNWIQNDYDKLEQFDTIYISMDMDQAGQDALKTILPRLGNHRCKIITLPNKDANDTLLAGHNLKDYLLTAKHKDPEEIKQATYFLDDVKKAFAGDAELCGDYPPWVKMVDKFRMRPGEITIWQGINGHGKSMALSQVISNLAAHRIKSCVASMEMRPSQQLMRMNQQLTGEEKPSCAYLDFVNDQVMPFLYIINIHGTAKSSRLLELFRYAVLRFGCRHFVVDSLAKCGMAEDDYNAQKAFVESLADFANSTMAHVHLVCHSRKQEDEASMPNKMDVKGTGALTDMVDNVISVWRNKKKEEQIQMARDNNSPVMPKMHDSPDCVLSIQKQRNFDWEGKIALWFDPLTHQYLEAKDDKSEPILPMKKEIIPHE